MKTIYEYPIYVSDLYTLELPEGAEILNVQLIEGHPCICAMVETEPATTNKEPHLIETFKTGSPIYNADTIQRKYIGTYQLQDGDLVFHVFERTGHLNP